MTSPVHRSPASLRSLFALLTLTIILSGCGHAKPASKAGPQTWFPLTVAGKPIDVQLAVTEPEQQQGLMFRRSLGAKNGMLFIFDKPGPQSFWMRNTYIPLDIGYFTADGVLREIYPMYPEDETPIPTISDNIQIALEMNQGWFKKNGLHPGARLNLDQVKAALTKRGFKPTSFFGE